MKIRFWAMGQALQRFAEKWRILLCALVALVLCGALALHNVSAGPLRNLNDIGGWHNRALFIAMTAVVHVSLLMICVLLTRVSFARTALRQLIVTAGFYIMLLAINQKSYVYLNVMQPVVRAMDTGGLAAGAAMESGLSAPALLLTYLITRGPVYDMYLLKLFSVACFLFVTLLLTRFADRGGLGLRAETLLALCVILPQGFMNAACSTLPEFAALALLGASLTAAFDADGRWMMVSAVCYGAACALCGACLYALPVYGMLAKKGRIGTKQMIAALVVMLVLCVPAILAGVPVGRALGSLLHANLGLPAYASGAPSLYHIVPRALVEETPQYAPILRHLSSLDFETHAQQFYTPAHFASVMHGLTLAALAGYLGLCALVSRMERKTALHRIMTLVLGALMICPNVSAAAWLALDVLCIYAILAQPSLRIPACMLLFATAAGSCYPMTEEVLVPMICAFVLCLIALCMLLDVIPAGKEERTHG